MCFYLDMGLVLDTYEFSSVRNLTSACSEGEKFERATAIWLS